MNKNIDEIIIEAYNKDNNITNISKKYKISRQGIYNILNRNKINYKKQTRNIDVEILKKELKRNKMKYVMDKYNIPYSQIRKIINNEEIEKREILKNVLNVNDVNRLYKDVGMSDKEIAEIFNCSQYTVRSFRWQNNIYNRNRQWQKELTKRIYMNKRKMGKTLKQISDETGFPYHIVAKAKKIYEDREI